MNLDGIKKIHFIGIGGIGVSAIARMFLAYGVEVSGSDTEESEITKELEKKGTKISYEHKAENIADDVDLVVYTVAINKDNPELLKAQQLNQLGNPVTKLCTYSQMLGIISDGYYTIAISGTHGKTTTTAMIAKVTVDNSLDPTVIVGSLMKDSGSNLIFPKDSPREKPLFIVEACEYKRSFLDLNPNILVITNIEEDHLDYYKDLADIQSAFRQLVNKLGEEDFVVCNPEDAKVAPVLQNAKCKIIDYTDSLRGKASQLELKVFGKYNQQNAKVAFAVAEILKVEENKILKALSEFEGVWRRFEYKGKMENGAQVYDDYAHHPTEIRAVLKASREKFPEKKMIAVFQPHLYSRTKLLLSDMASSFIQADKVLITPIYAAREKNDPSINNKILASEINKNSSNAKDFGDFEEIKQYLRENTGKDDIIITIGAGDIYKVGESLIK